MATIRMESKRNRFLLAVTFVQCNNVNEIPNSQLSSQVNYFLVSEVCREISILALAYSSTYISGDIIDKFVLFVFCIHFP